MSINDHVGSTTAPRVSEPPRVGKGSILAFLAAYMGAFLIIIVPISTSLAVKIAEIAPDNKEAVLGSVSAVGALLALFANPVFGALSDRTTARFGMRRPWILGGSIVAAASLIAMAFANSAVAVGALWAVTQLSLNAVLAGLAAFIPDRVPEEQRGKVSGFTGIAQNVAPLVGIVIANIGLKYDLGTPGLFILPSLLGLILVAIFVFCVRDRVLSPNLKAPFKASDIYGVFMFNPRTNPDFGWAWIGRFFMILAYSFTTTYQVYFLTDRFKYTVEQVAGVQLILLLVSVGALTLSAAISGYISDKTGKRKVFVFIASAVMAAGAGLSAFSFDLWLYMIAAAITGAGTGAYFAVDLALVTDVLPDKESAAAKDMGVFNIANALPQSIAPAIAPGLLAIGGVGGNYIALFMGAAAAAIIGAITVIPIKKVR